MARGHREIVARAISHGQRYREELDQVNLQQDFVASDAFETFDLVDQRLIGDAKVRRRLCAALWLVNQPAGRYSMADVWGLSD